MTRPSKNTLVLDGEDIKFRLQAHRTHTQTPVHVDWLRFTCARRNAPVPGLDILFPKPKTDSIWDEDRRGAAIQKAILATITENDHASMQALELARIVCTALGPDYFVEPEIKKGHDFYKHRWPITRNNAECGWVGFGASSDSPRQQSQAKTIHCNLFGAACTFAAPGWAERLAMVIDDHGGDITRADLALDFFDGLPRGLDGVKDDYMAGLCDSNGKRLKCNMVGDWCNGQARSFYFGSKEAGKQTNIYEKGDQLFGVEAGSNWHRIELRYGNKLRVLPSDILRRPADFFAGASDWHASALSLADCYAEPAKVATTPRLALETVQAEVVRNVRWAYRTAAATMSVCFEHMGDEFLDLLSPGKVPGRLSKFSVSELKKAFSTVSKNITAEGAGYTSALAI